jgi:hypothetical protein
VAKVKRLEIRNNPKRGQKGANRKIPGYFIKKLKKFKITQWELSTGNQY